MVGILDKAMAQVNQPPTVTATATPTTVASGGTVNLEGVANDPDGDSLNYVWSAPGNQGDFDTPGIANTEWVAPSVPQDTTIPITLTVSDPQNAEATATVEVMVQEDTRPPMPDPGPTSAERRQSVDRANRQILSSHTATIASNINQLLNKRINNRFLGRNEELYYHLGGKFSSNSLVSNSKEAFEKRSKVSLEKFLQNSSFLLPLSILGDSEFGLDRFAIWGAGNYHSLSGGNNNVDWDGEVLDAYIGADADLAEYGILAGLVISFSNGSFDYTDTTIATTNSSYESRMVSFHPYLAWSFNDDRIALWLTGGYGEGNIEINDNLGVGASDGTSDTNLFNVAIGLRGKLFSSERLGGITTLQVKSDASSSQVDIDGDQTGTVITRQAVDARRFRLGLEAIQEHELSAGGRLLPLLGLGFRHDGGDADTGIGMEVEGSLRYTRSRLTIEGRVHGLLAHENNYEEWGASFLIRVDAGTDGQGLSLSLQPVYGRTESQQLAFWEQEAGENGFLNTGSGSQLEARMGYGLASHHRQIMLTPYAGLTLGDTSQHLKLGGDFKLGPLSMRLEGKRQEGITTEADHSVILRGEIAF